MLSFSHWNDHIYRVRNVVQNSYQNICAQCRRTKFYMMDYATNIDVHNFAIKLICIQTVQCTVMFKLNRSKIKSFTNSETSTSCNYTENGQSQRTQGEWVIDSTQLSITLTFSINYFSFPFVSTRRNTKKEKMERVEFCLNIYLIDQ